MMDGHQMRLGVGRAECGRARNAHDRPAGVGHEIVHARADAPITEGALLRRQAALWLAAEQIARCAALQLDTHRAALAHQDEIRRTGRQHAVRFHARHQPGDDGALGLVVRGQPDPVGHRDRHHRVAREAVEDIGL